MSRTSWMILLCLAACESSGPPRQIEVDDATVIESTAPLWEGVRIVAPEPLITIGAASGGGPNMFAGLSGARFLSGGRIGVGDSQADRIQVFDSTGQHAITLGRPGEGPGEFRDLGRIYAYPGDSVAGFDFGLSRTLIFAVADGGSRAVSGLHFDARTPVLGVLGTGSLVSYQNIPSERTRPSGMWDSLRIVLVPSNGRDPQDIAHVPFAAARGGPGSPQVVLAPRSVMATARDGFYWARSDRYEIFRFDSSGSVLQVIRRPVEPVSISAADEKEYREGTLAGARENGGDQAEQLVARQLRDATFASTRPLFGSAFVDQDGRLWVSELPWPSRYVAPRRWSVFDTAGRWLGDVEAPAGLSVEDARGDRVLGAWKDEFGVAFVRVHRLMEPA